MQRSSTPESGTTQPAPDHTYAADGKIMVRIPRRADAEFIPRNKLGPNRDQKTAAIGRDRAVVVTTAILQVVRETLIAWLRHDHADTAAMRADIEEILRDEFADAERHAVSDISSTD